MRNFGTFTINVLISESMDLTSAILRLPDGLARYPSDAHWQTKLEAAQNVLFCKELFAQVIPNGPSEKLPSNV